jgi:mono/diheme cytochrome c family protein
MNGMLAANFITDKARLAKSDEDLLKSIRDGVTGKVGTMPPWGTTLSEEEQRHVLAYLRKQFGGS